ncbi:MAG: pyrroline-5-carboxylate reductase [Lachnospiraceae bacterium]|jgi:pyrroline-5-carboxylate reductase|nr:pyrroline-5-carboxylate reductase [Lachnospiraceae bacterium]
MNKTIGFIGGGNMASAIIGGILRSGLASTEQIIATAKTEETLHSLRERFDICATFDNSVAASQSDILFLAVKPYLFSEIIPEIKDSIRPETLIISIAAGQTLHQIESAFEKEIHLIRAMPNTPALVGEAMSALCTNQNVTESELEEAFLLFQSFGKCQVVSESMIDTVIGVSGSSPAYVYLFIEAMADAAVADGMPRTQAYQFAAQSVLGAAKMVLDTDLHPGVLKDAVCSPGGTTIEAVAMLEQLGLRNAVITAQRACVKKSKDMSRQPTS